MLVEVNVFVCWKCIEDMRLCNEMIDLYVDIGCRDCILFVQPIPLGVNFRKLKAQSSNVPFATFQSKQTFEL